MTGHNLIENIEIEVDREGEIRFYEVDVIVSWTHDPGVWTYSNGDPGRPESFDWDFQIIHAYETVESGEVHELGVEYFDELYSPVHDKLEEMDIEKLKG